MSAVFEHATDPKTTPDSLSESDKLHESIKEAVPFSAGETQSSGDQPLAALSGSDAIPKMKIGVSKACQSPSQAITPVFDTLAQTDPVELHENLEANSHDAETVHHDLGCYSRNTKVHEIIMKAQDVDPTVCPEADVQPTDCGETRTEVLGTNKGNTTMTEGELEKSDAHVTDNDKTLDCRNIPIDECHENWQAHQKEQVSGSGNLSTCVQSSDQNKASEVVAKIDVEPLNLSTTTSAALSGLSDDNKEHSRKVPEKTREASLSNIGGKKPKDIQRDKVVQSDHIRTNATPRTPPLKGITICSCLNFHRLSN